MGWDTAVLVQRPQPGTLSYGNQVPSDKKRFSSVLILHQGESNPNCFNQPLSAEQSADLVTWINGLIVTRDYAFK